MSSNKFNGPLPDFSRPDGRAQRFRGLYLSDNELEGNIHESICGLTSLEALFLDDNKLSGNVPACLGDLIRLEQLYLFGNEFVGEVPSELGSLEKLSKYTYAVKRQQTTNFSAYLTLTSILPQRESALSATSYLAPSQSKFARFPT